MDWESLVRPPEPAPSALQLGSVPFLYAEPLLHGLRDREALTLLRMLPDSLAQEFAAGSCQAALLPVLDAIRKTRSRIVPGIGACAASATGSERLVCRVPPAEVKSVSVTSGSTSSGALAVILLAELFSAQPQLLDDSPGADACVLEGDTGMRSFTDSPLELDLGALWNQLTGLPLVLAVWSLGDAANTAQLRALLQHSLQSGLDNMKQIIEEGSRSRGIDLDTASQYLQRLHYRIGGAEMDSIRTLVSLAKKHNLCTADTPLTFC